MTFDHITSCVPRDVDIALVNSLGFILDKWLKQISGFLELKESRYEYMKSGDLFRHNMCRTSLNKLNFVQYMLASIVLSQRYILLRVFTFYLTERRISRKLRNKIYFMDVISGLM